MPSSFNINPGAIGEVQETLILLLQYYVDTVSTTISSSQAVISAIRQTLLNELNGINAYTYQIQMAQEASLLNQMQSLALGLSSADQELITNRILGINSFVATSYDPTSLFTFNLDLLKQGKPAFDFPDYLAYLLSFTGEPISIGLTLDNFVATVEEEAIAWQNAVNALQQSSSPIAINVFDAVNRMAACSSDVHRFLTSVLTYLKLPTTIPLITLWNLLIAVPTILRTGSLLVNNPISLINQMVNSNKYLIFLMIQSTNAILVSYKSPATAINPSTTVVRQGESLLDIAARTFGDVEQWQTIAKLNGLVPPYVLGDALPGTAHPIGTVIPGDALYLSSSGTSVSPISSYFDVFLGTDINFGPLFKDEVPWSGDFATVSGYNNYGGALARAVLTQLTTLIYHPNYGTIIPGQIGGVSTSNTALLLASSLKAAVLADARTQSVSNVQAISLGPYSIGLRATAIPKGDISGGTSVAFQINTAASNATAITS